jgi:hypothetical protein
MTLRSAVRHSAKAIAEGTLIALLVVGLVAGAALAAKGGSGTGKPSRDTGSTMSVVVLDGSDATPNHTERVTFDVSTSATDRPFVQLMCWQGSTGVYNKSIGIFYDYLFDPWFTLDSSYWADGQTADCTARLYYYDKRGNQKDLKTMGVAVAP